MSVERIYYCEGPDCGGEGGLKGGHSSTHIRTAIPPPHLPAGFLEVRGDGGPSHFCTWGCLMKFAATIPPSETIPWGRTVGEDPDDERGE